MTYRRPIAALSLALAAGCAVEDDLAQIDQEAAASAGSRWPVVDGNKIYYYVDNTGAAGQSLHTYDTTDYLPHCRHSLAGVGVSAADEADIDDAVAKYEAETPLRFEKLTSFPATYPGHAVLIFTGGDYLTPHGDGRPDGTYDDWPSCIYVPIGEDLSVRTYQHEIGHNLGLIHEQRRSDRDDHVTVDVSDPDCLGDVGEEAYEKVDAIDNDLLAPYDTKSLMHYGSGQQDPSCPYNILEKSDPGCDNWDPSCGCATTDPDYPDCRIIVKGTGFSPHDRNALYRMYEAPLGESEVDDALGSRAIAADFDGDGYEDLAVGAPGEAPYPDPETGAVFLFKGTEGGLVNWVVLRESDFGVSLHDGDRFGDALAARDLDGDDDAELIVGAPGYTDNIYADAGAVFIYDGKVKTWPAPLASITSPHAATEFGAALAIGKFDGTNQYVAVGAPGKTGYITSGYVHVYRFDGASTFTYADALYPGESAGVTAHAGDEFGSAFAVADFNGDDLSDLAVGAPQTSVSGVGGAVFVYKGGSSVLTSAGSRLTDTTWSQGGRFGAALADGAFRGDGFEWPSGDTKHLLAVGAPGKSSSSGRVYVYQPVATIQGGYAFSSRQELSEANSNLGLAVNADDKFGEVMRAPDIDGDGIDDLVIGIPHEDVNGVLNAGALAFFKGVAGANLAGWGSGTQQVDRWPNRARDQFGAAIAFGYFGDYYENLSSDNDERIDMAVGIPGKSAGPSGGATVADAGSVQEYLGANGSMLVHRQTLVQDASTPE